ncbi:MAG: LicD family protein [Lachnospiraceae bacterium]|nr:LicD family protein [Lachnospiraceae bacterium]
MYFEDKFFEAEERCGYHISEKMKKVWAVELKLLDYFDQLCREHNLRYYIAYGTLLGAVRHQGFIPWDDDIDVVMFRDDYEKLKVIAGEVVEYPYFFQNSYTDTMIWAFAKLRDSRTTAIEFPDFPSEFHQGIFIDIFPLDDVPDNTSMKPIIGEMQREIWMSIVEPERLKGLIDRGQQLALDADILLELLRMPIRERMKIFEDFSASRFGASSRVNFLTDDFVGYPNMLREWYADTVYLPFENMAVPAPAAYESLLSCLYGDYMTPAQIPNMHEGIFLDPDASYTQYMNKEGV